MSLSDINLYYKLETVFLSPEQLYLDPNNPRLIVDSEDDIKYSTAKIMSNDVQSDILDKINKNEFKVNDLKKSIIEKGFMNGTSPLIVKEIKNSENYLVLEGNRRTAAIKNIINNNINDIEVSCKKTLNNIEVKVFQYSQNELYTEEQIINVILGQIHVAGALGWGAMERAHYIHRSYLMELSKNSGSLAFVKCKTSIKNVSDIYSFKESEVTKNLKIYRVYEQIKHAGYQIKSDRFTLIDLSVSDSNLSNEYFGLNNDYQFSDVGINRFINLIVSNNGPITNPKLFKEFSFIFKNGNDVDVSSIENKASDLSEVYYDVKKRKKGNYLYNRLSQIHQDLMKIDISELSELSNTSREFKEANKIVHIIIKKVYPIVESINKSKKNAAKKAALTINDINNSSSKEINNIIRETFKLMPNKTCNADIDVIVKKSLRYLDIITRGSKRDIYSSIIKKEVMSMLSAGIIKTYKTGKNERFKLIG